MSVNEELSMAGVMAQLRDVFRQAFFDDSLEIRDTDTAADVDGWDSLSHVRLLVAIERRFGIGIAPGEADRLDTVGDLARLIARKLSQPRSEGGTP